MKQPEVKNLVTQFFRNKTLFLPPMKLGISKNIRECLLCFRVLPCLAIDRSMIVLVQYFSSIFYSPPPPPQPWVAASGEFSIETCLLNVFIWHKYIDVLRTLGTTYLCLISFNAPTTISIFLFHSFLLSFSYFKLSHYTYFQALCEHTSILVSI
jgi:hypothetical protein